MYDWLDYSKNCSKATWSFWNYNRDEPNSGVGGANNNINCWIKGFKSFDYKTSIKETLKGNNTEKEVEIVTPLKHLSNFWKILDMSLINFEINLILIWSEKVVLTSKTKKRCYPYVKPAAAVIDNTTNATFKITDTKLSVFVVTLSTETELLGTVKNRF